MATRRKAEARYKGPVHICGRPFPIVWEEAIIDGYGRECEGLYDKERERILLKVGLTPAQEEEAILHEIIEGLNDAFELKLRHDKIMALGRGLWAAGVRYEEGG